MQGVCATYGQFRTYDGSSATANHFILRAEKPPRQTKDALDLHYAKTDARFRLMRFVFSSVEFGRPYALPPGTPRARGGLRKAFADAVQDPALVAEADALKLDMTYRSPQDLERLVANLYETPPEMVETVKKLVPGLQ